MNIVLQYRGPLDSTVICEPLDGMVAVYDRRAGVTHMLAEPAVVILDALRDGEADLDDLLARLSLGVEALPLLTERLAELVPTGLVDKIAFREERRG